MRRRGLDRTDLGGADLGTVRSGPMKYSKSDRGTRPGDSGLDSRSEGANFSQW
jgi:hypothetical protein